MPAPSDLVHQTSTSTGTGNLTLAAVNGKRTFLTAFGTGGTNTFDYFISNRDAAEWERGTGHEDSGALVRDTVIASSNSNNAVNFSAGTKDITNDIPAGEQVRSSQIRKVLTADRTYYVRADGSDSNDGLTDSSGGAFLTIQKAIDTVAALDLSIHAVTIRVGDGTYTTSVALKSLVGSGTVTIEGNTSTPSNVTISVTGAAAISAANVSGTWVLKGLKVTTASSGAGISLTGNRTFVRFSAIDFGSTVSTQLSVSDGAMVEAEGNYAISGGAPVHMAASRTGVVKIQGRTITLSGTPAFSSTFVSATQLGMVAADNNTYSGGATGARYSVQLNSVINTGGAGAEYFPGNSAGSSATGGQYF